MARFFCILLISITLLWPAAASAGEARVGINFLRQDDGTTVGELWFGDRVVWRLKVLGDGAQPVAGGSGPRTTVIAPDLDEGLFRLKVYNQ
jgi:hypothetical protein